MGNLTRLKSNGVAAPGWTTVSWTTASLMFWKVTSSNRVSVPPVDVRRAPSNVSPSTSSPATESSPAWFGLATVAAVPVGTTRGPTTSSVVSRLMDPRWSSVASMVRRPPPTPIAATTVPEGAFTSAPLVTASAASRPVARLVSSMVPLLVKPAATVSRLAPFLPGIEMTDVVVVVRGPETALVSSPTSIPSLRRAPETVPGLRRRVP